MKLIQNRQYGEKTKLINNLYVYKKLFYLLKYATILSVHYRHLNGRLFRLVVANPDGLKVMNSLKACIAFKYILQITVKE